MTPFPQPFLLRDSHVDTAQEQEPGTVQSSQMGRCFIPEPPLLADASHSWQMLHPGAPFLHQNAQSANSPLSNTFPVAKVF